MSGAGVLVVAGEASGDRIAALTASALAARGVHAFGVGGPACGRAGVDLIADGSRLASMGITDVALRVPELAAAMARLAMRVMRTPPRAALLVNFTELNVRLGRLLRARGVPVLWCVAPQVWAWRRGRTATVRGATDRLAVILPFEEQLWRDAGVDARYVGHPSLDVPAEAREAVRARLGIAPGARAVAVLAGSRAGEVLRLAEPLCRAAAMLRESSAVDHAVVIPAPGLSPRAASMLATCARQNGLAVHAGDPAHGAAPLLAAFDVALCASGTASLEAALAGAAPVVTYRMDPLSFAVARRLVRTPHIALPNVLLGRRAFPELVQREVTPARIAEEARTLLARPNEVLRLGTELRACLAHPSKLPFGERVAALLHAWIA